MTPYLTPPPPPPPPSRSNDQKIVIIAVVATFVCLCLCAVTLAALLVANLGDLTDLPSFQETPSGGETSISTPTRAAAVRTPSRTPTSIATPAPVTPSQQKGALETLQTLTQAEVPINDMRDLARRLRGVKDIPETMPAPAQPYKVGDTQKFWVNNDDTDAYVQVSARLAYITPHVYFWAEDGLKLNQTALQKLVDTFEEKMYPTDRQFFGSEWTPGIDNDPHLYIIYTSKAGARVAGYFSSNDELPPQAFEHSNAHETFILNSSQNLSDVYTYSVLAHEFQHMIHWYQDRNEEGWVNEGFSELAAFLNGYDVGGWDTAFAAKPNLQLNDWPNDKALTGPHYGASFLFFDYFLDRFGDKVTKAIVADKENDFTSIDRALTSQGISDPLSKALVTSDDVFADWVLANYLKDDTVGDGRFIYKNYPKAPTTKDTTKISTCPAAKATRSVAQYGAEYIRIACRGQYTLTFQGSQEVGVIPASAHSGLYAFWSNKGDESDMTLTQTFDLTALKGQVDLTYWTWYDLEEHYDFVYLEASTDGGQTWQIVRAPSTTDDKTTGANYGWGYNNVSEKWIQEKVDLSAFAGKKVTLKFEYITDAAVNGEGLLLDDIAIPQLNYQSDFENDLGGWQAAGFVRIQNRLPQTYRVSLIQGIGGQRSVQYITVKPDQTFSLPLNLSADAVLVVSGTTRFTRLPAAYTFSIQP